MKYNECPSCGISMPAHKGHTKTFNKLTDKEKSNSIKVMTINLKRAIKKHSGASEIKKKEKYLRRFLRKVSSIFMSTLSKEFPQQLLMFNLSLSF